MRTLAADVGGTKTLLALYEQDSPGRVAPTRRAVLPSADHESFEAALSAFLGEERPVLDGAAVAVAGPVVGGRAKATNLPWQLDEATISQRLGGARVRLMNDFHAVALGLGELRDDELRVLQEGTVDPAGPQVVLGAGTGLGKAVVVPTADGPRVLASEGGHVAFAPRDRTEQTLLARMQAEHGRVSLERVISGPGLVAIYRFMVEMRRAPENPAVAARMTQEDPARVISELGGSGADPACEKALALFVARYGAAAGDFALEVLPTGGLFIAGGIAPKILDVLERGPFMEAFADKGRMGDLLGTFRVSVVLEPDVGLFGAAAAARAL